MGAHRDQPDIELVRVPVDRGRDVGDVPLVHMHDDVDVLAAQSLGVLLQVALRIGDGAQVRLAVDRLGRLAFEHMQQQKSCPELLRERPGRG